MQTRRSARNELAGFLNPDVVFIQKPDDFRQRKPGSFQANFFRIDRIVKGRAEIGFKQQGIFKHSPGQITVVEDGAGQISICKIGFLQLGVFENGSLDFCPEKRRVMENAIVKPEGKPKPAALVEAKAKHLAVFENDILKGGFGQAGQTQVTTCKTAVGEPDGSQVGVTKLAVCKLAAIVFPFG